MLTKQTILIIGTGYTGRAIAARLANGNFHVLLCDKDHTKAMALVNELKSTAQACDVEAMQCSFESAWEADIIMLAMHLEAQQQVAEIIKDVVNQKILICTIDAVGDTIAALSSTGSQVAALQQLLPNTKIVMIFNDDAGHQDAINKSITEVLIAGNDDIAVETVSGIFESVGINTIRTKNLSNGASVNNLPL